MINFEISGIKEFSKKLGELEPKLKLRVERHSLRAGAKVILAEEKSLAPKGETGNLQKSFKILSSRTRGKFVQLNIVPKREDAFYAWWVIIGHKTPKTKGGKKSSGKGWIIGNDFVEQALANKGQEAAKVIADDAQNEIRKIFN